MIGRTISHYRILELLGRGGMGEVYLAEDVRLGHKVAIKRLRDRGGDSHALRARFEREAKAVAHLSHPNILRLLEFDEIDSDLAIVMEYAGGGSLRQFLARGDEKFDLDRFLELALQAAEGLAAAHRGGVLHRDIKPDNLLLTESGELRIADFGLAALEEETQITQAGAVMGTFAYMAPEQMRGQPVDARADIYALGVTLRELLFGSRPPSDASGPAGDDTVPLTTRRLDVPRGLSQLLDRMTADDREQRIASAEEVAEALRAMSATGGHGKGSRRGRSRALRTMSFALTVVVLAVLGLLLRPRFQGELVDTIQAVAVLPLRDVSADGSGAQLAAGLTDAIILGLSRNDVFSVISRRSSEQVAAMDLTMPEIAERLGVDAILEGSVSQLGDRVLITASLVQGRTDRNIWVQEFQAELRDIFRLQHEVASAVAAGIGGELGTETRATERSIDPDLLRSYLEARALWEQRSDSSIRRSVALLDQITQADPAFVEAWVGLADALIVMPSYCDTTVTGTYPAARAAALRAIELDPQNAEAWNVLAEVAWYYDFDYAESERLRIKSLELNPSAATTHQWYAECLAGIGRFDEALLQVEIAQELDPLSPLMKTLEGSVLSYARRYPEALAVFRQVLSSHPDFVLARVSLAMTLKSSGRLDEAAQAFLKWRRLIGTPDAEIARLTRAFEQGGYAEYTRVSNAGFLARAEAGQFVKARTMASIGAQIGDTEMAFEWLERSYRDRDILLLRPAVNPALDGLREDPRFVDLMRRLGLESLPN